MARIIIDGYNLLAVTEHSNREGLIRAVATYAKLKNHDIVIVFDGTKGGGGELNRSMESGIEVMYSPLTVQADDIIEEMLALPNKGNPLVVSSDRRIQKAAVRTDATFVTSEEFDGRLQMSRFSADLDPDVPPWMEGREDEYRTKKPQKKLSKKLSKTERRRRKRLEKL